MFALSMCVLSFVSGVFMNMWSVKKNVAWAILSMLLMCIIIIAGALRGSF